MNALEKIKLLKEHGELINQVLAGGLKPLAKIQSLKRINEIIELLGGNGKPDFTQLVIDENATNKERRKVVETWLRENLQGKTITTVDGKKVYFNRNKSIDHLTNDGYVGVLEAKATTKIVEVLVSGTFIEVEELKKVRKDNFVAFHKYRKWVQIDDKQVHLQVKVGQFEDGRLELQIGTNLLAYSQKIIGKDSLLNSHQLLDGILANATGLYPNQFNTKSIPQNTELSAGMLNADENHSIMLDSLQDDDATLTILQVLDKNGNDITDDVLGDTDTNSTTNKQEYADTLLFNKGGQILLAQRSAKDDFKPNKWWIVGGKIEQGETPKQGAIRELAEETDVKLSDLTFVEKVNLSTGDISHRFAGVVKDDTPIHLKKDELQAYAWVNTDKLGENELLGTLGDLQKLFENGFDLIKFEFVPSGKTPLDPNEIQPLHIDDPSKTKKAVETYLKQFKDKYITTVDGKNVVFNSKGRNHLANDVVFGDEMVAQVIEKVAEILTQGKFIERQPLTKVRTKDDYVAFHKYRKWVLIDNAEFHLQVKVAELTDGSFEMGNGLIAYSAKNAEYEDEKKATTPPVSPSFDGLLINSGDCRLLNNNTAFDKLSQEYNQIGNLTDEYIFIEILEVRPLGATNIKNQAPFDRTHIHIPRTKTTRQKANNQAFAILDKLDNGEITPTDLTDDDKQILAKYSGNGGALKGRDGKIGSDYEYYTPKELATGMWDLAKELGFNGGRVLDPCCGTGVFTATSPDNVLMDNIELDETSGKISQLLNDGNRSTTTISPFEKIVNSYDDGDDDNGFDMVITNVPFGDNSARGANKLHDTAYQDASLDYYFIMRTLEKLKSGGLAVLMTAPSTITGKGAKQIELRQKTSRIAEFLGAYRLPNSMFTDTGADVSVDIMVFKKYNTHMIDSIAKHYDNGNLELLQQVGVLWDDYLSGHYFVHHKRNVLGTEVQAKNRFGDEIIKVQSDLSQAEIAKLFRKFDSRINWEC